MTTTISKTTIKIRFLKSELKRLASLQREVKQNTRHNQSTFDKYLNGSLTKEEAEKLYKNVCRVDFGFHVYGNKEALTAGYIVYNQLRNRKPHIEEEKNVEYQNYIDKWMERLESLEEGS